LQEGMVWRPWWQKEPNPVITIRILFVNVRKVYMTLLLMVLYEQLLDILKWQYR
jgi:hypothetical protein